MENKKGEPLSPQGLVVAPGAARLDRAAGAQLPTLGSVPQQSPLLQTGNAGGAVGQPCSLGWPFSLK